MRWAEELFMLKNLSQKQDAFPRFFYVLKLAAPAAVFGIRGL